MMPYLLFSSPSPCGQAKTLGLRAAMLGCSIAILTMIMPLPGRTAEFSQENQYRAAAALAKMFSPEIRKTLTACFLNGGVNLVNNNGKHGFVVCNDGSQKYKVPYQAYIDTTSDFLSAMTLISFNEEFKMYPPGFRQLFQAALNSESGLELIESAMKSSLSKTPIFGSTSGESLDIAVKEVLTRVKPFFQDLEGLSKLLDENSQYPLIVTKFCNSPGQSVAQAQSVIPGVSVLQLYASCIKASGLTEVIKARVNAKASPAFPRIKPQTAEPRSF